MGHGLLAQTFPQITFKCERALLMSSNLTEARLRLELLLLRAKVKEWPPQLTSFP